MPYAAADGPPDIDATHTWAPATGTAPPILNDQGGGAPDAVAWIALLGIAGWMDQPETDDRRAPRTVGEGEMPYRARMLGKTLVYELEARGPTIQAARALVKSCQRGFGLSFDEEGEMTVVPFAVPGGVTWTFSARTTLVTPNKRPNILRGVHNPFRWPFTISLRMSDPRFYTGGVGYL